MLTLNVCVFFFLPSHQSSIALPRCLVEIRQLVVTSVKFVPALSLRESDSSGGHCKAQRPAASRDLAWLQSSVSNWAPHSSRLYLETHIKSNSRSISGAQKSVEGLREF